MIIWYTHLLSGNTDWMVTSATHLMLTLYNFVLYSLKCPPDDPTMLKVSFLFIYGVAHIIYVVVSYFTD